MSAGDTGILQRIRTGGIQLIINTPTGKASRLDEGTIRPAAVAQGVPVVTTAQGADAYVQAIRALRGGRLAVTPIQRYHARG